MMKSKNIIYYAVSSVVGSALFVLMLCCIQTVPASHVGVPVTFGSVGTELFPEGFNFKNPLTNVHNMYIGVQKTKIKTIAASSDSQDVETGVSINYYVDRKNAINLYMFDPQMRYEALYVDPAIIETTKSVMSRYTAEELITKRAEVSNSILLSLSDKLTKYHIIINDINITDFSFSKVFTEAIEAKVTATQKAEQSKRDLERIKYEAEQKIVTAKAEAESIRIQSQAIQAQGGKDYVSLKAIEKWDGKMPMYTGGNSPTPFISIKP